MAIMKAVIIQETGKAALVDIEKQSMRPDYIRIRSVAVAVNPSLSATLQASERHRLILCS